MENISRIAEYLWPYRKRFVASVVCAIAIAALWCLNISAIAPVVKVLFENDSLHAFVDNTIEEAEEEIRLKTELLDSGTVETLDRQARAQDKIVSATYTLQTYKLVQEHIMPYVPQDRFNALMAMLGLMLLGTSVKCVFVVIQEILMGGIVQRAGNDIRRDCFVQTQKLDVQSIATDGTSGLLSRMTNDITELTGAVGLFGTKLIREPLKALGCVGVAFYVNWRLTLLSLLFVPLIGFMLAKFGKRLKKAAKNTLQSVAAIYDCISETFDSYRVVTAFGGQQRQQEKFEVANNQFYDKMLKCIRVNALIRPSSEVLGTITVLFAFIPGAYMVLRQTDSIFGIQLAPKAMTMTQLMLLYGLLAGTLDPLKKLSNVFGQVKRGLAGADRAFELMDRESLVAEPLEPKPFVRHNESIRFNDLSFRYHSVDAKEPRDLALRGVSLDVKFGERIAVVGSNGSGKSTLLSLLPRFMDPESGHIMIDGVDVADYSIADLRSQVGIVSQETMLFDDTVSENIKYGSFDATPEQVESAATQAHALSFIRQLPEGFDTVVGVGGRRLSGGQRQRLSLARAIIRDPSILILDEATSAVDAQSEDLIHGVLKKFAEGRTVFIITHVLSNTFLDLVDRIVVMDEGQITAIGTHEELIGSCEIYRRLTQAGINSPRAAA